MVHPLSIICRLQRQPVLIKYQPRCSAAASAIAPSLTEIFNKSIDSNRFPSDWKTARVIPLFKNGQRSVLDNSELKQQTFSRRRQRHLTV